MKELISTLCATTCEEPQVHHQCLSYASVFTKVSQAYVLNVNLFWMFSFFNDFAGAYVIVICRFY
uniref:Uncharacterized protein n=1 Tax=Kalanchoe fedtschenkoi TaxID=63787 RepID=A0A7N0T6N9_KALFE